MNKKLHANHTIALYIVVNMLPSLTKLRGIYKYKLKEKLEILSSIRDHRKKKSKETREVTYTCRYTSEHLIPNSVYTPRPRLN